ncbi:unnamed protein product [Brachionus calyciflorus]|uniref:Uncharacterized protein n=1 Tax=Brachionus calyciflorus TaxID=104777 RepID=A0A813PUL4_9BILA|nr:unnamed protein product [Brachionus calyciflorus]
MGSCSSKKKNKCCVQCVSVCQPCLPLLPQFPMFPSYPLIDPCNPCPYVPYGFGYVTCLIAYKYLWRGRQDTQKTTVQVISSMHVNNPNRERKRGDDGRLPQIITSVIKSPDVFRKGMDSKAWMTVMETFLKDYDKSEWVRKAISYIENNILKQLDKLDFFINDMENGCDGFKNSFVRVVAPVEATSQNFSSWTKLNEYKQAQNQSISDFGHKVIQLAKSLFPNMENTNYMDKIIQEKISSYKNPLNAHDKNNGFDNAIHIKNPYFTSETESHRNRKNNKLLDNYNYSKNSIENTYQNHHQQQNKNRNWKNGYQKNDFQAPKQQQQQQAQQLLQQTQQKTQQKEPKQQTTETVLNKDSKQESSKEN